MRIVADENIAEVVQYFGGSDELVLAPGRQINAGLVRDADVLLVRSVTRVNEALLRDSRCRFVGTATSGIDHVDTAFLQSAGMAFASARGCNAEAVTDYVFSALAALSGQDNGHWLHKSIGIVGCGEVGSRLARRCLALQMPVAIHDPLLPLGHDLRDYCTDFRTVLQSRIITFHTPLTEGGDYPTRHMLGAPELDLLAPDAILINASRGPVINNRALLEWLHHNRGARAVLDVWEGEPVILPGLLESVALGTAHIAGYSLEGKLRGTQMIHRAFREYLGLPADASPGDQPTVLLEQSANLDKLILSAYDIRRDDAALRHVAGQADADRAFDYLRKSYPPRHEFGSCRVDPGKTGEVLAQQARAVGFRLA
jgi:erythronate-4-phosphate dehydrogenase